MIILVKPVGIETIKKLMFLVVLAFAMISMVYYNKETIKVTEYYSSSSSDSPLNIEKEANNTQSLESDYYRESCPKTVQIIRSTLYDLYKLRPDIGPTILRLLFHDCFVKGCDASVLLDDAEGVNSEKEAPPNESLKGFDLIDIIKWELEAACPGIVSCADILVLAARECVFLAGGPFYPIYTGRRDSTLSFPEVATNELPRPQDDLSKTIASFASRGFDEREAVLLLGSISHGMIHCKFFNDWIYKFSITGGPDDRSPDIEFINLLRSRCLTNETLPSPTSRGIVYLLHYRRSILEGRAENYVVQQQTAREDTKTWVIEYFSNATIFQQDFGLAMMKLSSYRLLTAPMGQVRLNCRKVV